jgi:hypothetical protein
MRILKMAGFAATIVSATIAQAATLAYAAPAATPGTVVARGLGTTAATGQETTRTATVKPAGGHIAIYFTPRPHKSLILVAGAIGDYGTGVAVNAKGQHDAAGQFERVTLQQGSFIIDNRKLNRAAMATDPVTNPQTCSLVLDVQAPAPLSGGTGRYAGISGTVTLSSNLAAIFPQKSGSTGTCNFDTSPLNTALSTSAEGRISFS